MPATKRIIHGMVSLLHRSDETPEFDPITAIPGTLAISRTKLTGNEYRYGWELKATRKRSPAAGYEPLFISSAQEKVSIAFQPAPDFVDALRLKGDDEFIIGYGQLNWASFTATGIEFHVLGSGGLIGIDTEHLFVAPPRSSIVYPQSLTPRHGLMVIARGAYRHALGELHYASMSMNAQLHSDPQKSAFRYPEWSVEGTTHFLQGTVELLERSMGYTELSRLGLLLHYVGSDHALAADGFVKQFDYTRDKVMNVTIQGISPLRRISLSDLFSATIFPLPDTF